MNNIQKITKSKGYVLNITNALQRYLEIQIFDPIWN